MAVTPFQDLPLAPRDTVFDGLAADKRVRKWASSDGSGSKEKMNWDTYRKAHFWYDQADPHRWASYKFNFCDIDSKGQLKAVPRGVFAVAKSIQGARGGFVGVSDDDVARIKRHLERYYSKISAQEGKQILAPWNPKSEARTHGKKREMAMEIASLDAIVEKPLLVKQLESLDFQVLSQRR